jgi:predicted metal-dependent phosphoesterase TrpH
MKTTSPDKPHDFERECSIFLKYILHFEKFYNRTKKMIDLHTHSSVSDGILSPAQLMDYAFQKKISVIALTDHNTVDGLEEAQTQAKKIGMEFVPGIEISVEWPTGEFHLLGLGLKRISPELKEIVSFLKNQREERNKKMVSKLQSLKIDVSYEELVAKYPTHNLGRPHIADFLAEKKIVKSRQEAFNNFFAKGRPCFVEQKNADLEKSVEAVKKSGGIPVQAHPLSIYVSWGKMEETLESIRNKGVEGLEAFHPGARYSEACRFVEIAKKLGMICTAGSDFHGEKIRADRKIGFSAGNYKISDNFWTEELKPALEKIHGTDHSFSA